MSNGIREPLLARSLTGKFKTLSGDDTTQPSLVHQSSHRHFGDGTLRMRTQNECNFHDEERLQNGLSLNEASMPGDHWQVDKFHPSQKYHKRRFKLNEDNMYNEPLDDKNQKLVINMVKMQENLLTKF